MNVVASPIEMQAIVPGAGASWIDDGISQQCLNAGVTEQWASTNLGRPLCPYGSVRRCVRASHALPD